MMNDIAPVPALLVALAVLSILYTAVREVVLTWRVWRCSRRKTVAVLESSRQKIVDTLEEHGYEAYVQPGTPFSTDPARGVMVRVGSEPWRTLDTLLGKP